MCNLSLIIGETNVQPKSTFCINPSLTSMKSNSVNSLFLFMVSE